MPLTDQQQVFVDEYLSCWNATRAALAAPFGIAAATVAALLINQAWHKLVNKAT
jgi:phage terminase small subunit